MYKISKITHNNTKKEIGDCMDKKWIVCIIIAIILGLATGIGLAIYSSNRKGDTEGIDIISDKELADENIASNIENSKANSIETIAKENTVSPNAIIIEKVYYEGCDHLIRKTVDVPETLVNKTEEEVEKQYSDWKVEEYTPTQITLYKTVSGNCGEHYFVQEHNGVIGIYTTDQYGVKTLKEDTEIVTQYLPEADLQKLKAGVEIIGHTKLVEFLEDYE